MTVAYILASFSVFISLFSGFFNIKNKPILRLVAKLTASLLFIATGLVAAAHATVSPSVYLMVIAALVFGMLGDVFLVLKKMGNEIGEKVFDLFGMLTFLLGHIVFVVIFLSQAKFNFYLLPIVFFFPLGFLISKFLGVLKAKKIEFIASLAYSCVLGLMAASAINMFVEKPSTMTILIMTAGILFALSDSALSIRMFGGEKVEKLHNILVYVVLITYYPAQVLFALSVAM